MISANFTHALHREMPDILIEWCSPQQISRDIEERLQIELDRCEELGPLVRGQAVIEEVLIGEFRGRGIAPVAQSLLIEQLAQNTTSELICGTIDDRNHASRATARRVGRREVAAWHWLQWD
ncbi:MAG: hypothetical protein ACLFVJ_23165 [Persicimonas sp.]